ncbi:MAG TPA: hypothetical protein VGD17_13125 [Chitinophagaceae bacterium]
MSILPRLVMQPVAQKKECLHDIKAGLCACFISFPECQSNKAMMEDLKEQDLRDTADHVSIKSAFSNFKQSTEDVVDTYYRLAVATATKKGANAAAAGVSGVLMAFLGALMFLFAFIGLAFWVGTLINSTAGGFLIVAGFFGLLLGLVVATKGRLIYPVIRNNIVKKVYEQQNNTSNNIVRGTASGRTAIKTEVNAAEG